MNYRLIEGCCGTAALSLYLCGVKQQIITYQGSKWNYREELAAILRSKGFSQKPKEIELYDPAPWSKLIYILNKNQKDVILKLKEFEKEDPLNLFKKINGSHCPENEIDFAAEFLFLQRLSFSGKAVGHANQIWNSPGFNKTSAYGIPGTSRFGQVKPMIPGLIKRLEDNKINLPLTKIGKYLPIPKQVKNTVLYLDPPYSHTTKYPDGDLTRQELIDLALLWYNEGAVVLVSESEIINELKGWDVVCISEKKKNKSNFKNKKAEYVMVSP